MKEHLKDKALDKKFLSKSHLEKVLKNLLISRYTDEKMNKLVKQNKGTTFFISNQGHELIGVLAAMSLDPSKDYSCCTCYTGHGQVGHNDH